MQQTTNYKLNKPELTDVADVTTLSENMDTIDDILAEHQKEINSIDVGVSSFNGSKGAVTGVSSYNGKTGAVTGVSSFNGETGAVTGVSSVNGKTGAVNILDMVYPVGAFYFSALSTNPSVLFGGTWQQVQGRFILAASDAYKAGSTGGEASHTLTINEMPSHNHGGNSGEAGSHNHNGTIADAGSHVHSASSSTTGNHTHDAGTMNITGQAEWQTNGGYNDGSGRGSYLGGGSYSGALSLSTCQNRYGMIGSDGDDTYTNTLVSLNAYKGHGWTGETSSNGNHSHTITINSAGNHNHSITINSVANHTHSISSQGGGAAHNNMPPYLVAYVWQRIA